VSPLGDSCRRNTKKEFGRAPDDEIIIVTVGSILKWRRKRSVPGLFRVMPKSSCSRSYVT